jgi:glycerol-3-phosphate dehydrogenase
MARLEHRLDKYNLEQTFDLAIIGGGINGAGVARDAAARGLKVILLEKKDFASGCSAHSTRLIHGGLRYLEHLEFSLVYESLQERELLLKNYPHLVSPLGLLIPTYKGNRNPLWKLKLGMWLYDFLSSNKSLDNHSSFNEETTKELDVKLEQEDLYGAVYYQDGQVPFAERLVLENILTAQRDGAICINHAEVTDIYCTQIHGEYHTQAIRFKDIINGKRPFTVHAKNIINMSGPWVDEVNLRFKDQSDETGIRRITKFNMEKRIGGTKGSHIVVKKFSGSPANFGIYNEAKSDHRPFFIIPFQVGGNDELFMIGTTDIFLNEDDDLDNLVVTEREIDYLLDETNHLFPEADLTREDIVNTFIGVRPLPAAKEGQQEGKVSRKHFIVNHEKEKIQNYYSVIGGKLTTFRSLAAEVVDLFSDRVCKTETTKTINSEFPKDLSFYDYVRDKTKEFSKEYDIEASSVIHLLLLYGSSAQNVLKLCKENPLLKERIDPEFADIEAQIVYAIREENAFCVNDILKRRISIGLCSNKNLHTAIKTIQYHLNEEYELYGRNRDKFFQSYLFTGTYIGENV